MIGPLTEISTGIGLVACKIGTFPVPPQRLQDENRHMYFWCQRKERAFLAARLSLQRQDHIPLIEQEEVTTCS
jgi:hypothetical protein